jgi:hypothetical protein
MHDQLRTIDLIYTIEGENQNLISIARKKSELTKSLNWIPKSRPVPSLIWKILLKSPAYLLY